MHELQNGRSSARDWFVQMAVKRNEQIRIGVTAQGLYIGGPDGSDYGFLNHRDPDRVMGFMDRGLQEYRANRPGEVEIAFSGPPSNRLPDSVASVIHVYSRIH